MRARGCPCGLGALPLHQMGLGSALAPSYLNCVNRQVTLSLSAMVSYHQPHITNTFSLNHIYIYMVARV